MDPSKQAKAVKKAVKATVDAAASHALAKPTWLDPPAADALVVRDNKAGQATQPGLDPRAALLLAECFRHVKASVAEAAEIVTGDDATAVFADLHAALGDRVWDRFDTVPS